MESITDAPHLFNPVALENDWAHHIKESAAISFPSRTCSCVDISSGLRCAFLGALTTFVHTMIEKVRIIGVTRHHHDN
jgi:hypothetical protein